MNDQDTLNLLPHGARWALFPGDFPEAPEGSLERRKQLLAWIAADPHRRARHRSRALRVGDRTIHRMFKAARRVIEREEFKAERGCEYINPSYRTPYESRHYPLRPGQLDHDTKWCDLPIRWVKVWAVTGSNEGHYVHVDLALVEGREYVDTPFMLLKTFGGWDHAHALARRLTELLGA